MKIHEYQAKAILSRYGVTTPRGEVAFTKEEAREAAQRLKSHITVVKAQIHAGGRGKAGGVKRARSAGEANDPAAGRGVFMARAAGGMEIEEVAKENPGAILREAIHPAVGLQPYQARKIRSEE